MSSFAIDRAIALEDKLWAAERVRIAMLELAKWHDAESNRYADYLDPLGTSESVFDATELQMAGQAHAIHRDAAARIRGAFAGVA